MKFLEKFANLSKSEQKVLLFCLKKIPNPRARTDDIQYIACALNLNYKTVWRSLQNISIDPLFSKLVKYIHSDISPSKTVKLEAIFLGKCCLSEFDYEAIDNGLVIPGVANQNINEAKS